MSAQERHHAREHPPSPVHRQARRIGSRRRRRVLACSVPDGRQAYGAAAVDSWAWAAVVASGSATAAMVAAVSTAGAEHGSDT
ncbi:hypothetical protein [Streptomyces sp. NPDC088246]|uniref:hypothetical protein n=1 Tax=Streptomyces sp. NPDC088246 TaxID=3365842 RepID=UPI003824B625